MSIVTLLALAALSLVLRLAFSHRGRSWALFIASIFLIFYLQPGLSSVKGLDFWLPVATLALTALSWVATSSAHERRWRDFLPALGALVGSVLLIASTRYISVTGVITPSRPPQLLPVVIGLIVIAFVLVCLRLLKKGSILLLVGVIVLLLALFIIIKLPALSALLTGWLQPILGGAGSAVGGIDLRWLGFSYVAFRLIHTLRDRMTGRLPEVTLQEYITYVIFFPAFTAGPIDRIERFIRDLRTGQPLTAEEFAQGGRRLAVGLFKKFALADSLALIALNATNALQVKVNGWMWVLLYAYTFQIYFDFSGYTDIAIGMGRWLGFQLPENFNAPYLKPNLTVFWNNWHMTLTQWFRAYFFNPVTRAMRSWKKPLQAWLIIFTTQLATMVLIGLWHGISWNFVLWGLWHGLGLFIHNRWSELLKPHAAWFEQRPGLKKALGILGMVITFNYVALGWVWFALPTVSTSLVVFGKLFGVGG
jgi:alginate O-acetyltransferase complex protein AlgI